MICHVTQIRSTAFRTPLCASSSSGSMMVCGLSSSTREHLSHLNWWLKFGEWSIHATSASKLQNHWLPQYSACPFCFLSLFILHLDINWLISQMCYIQNDSIPSNSWCRDLPESTFKESEARHDALNYFTLVMLFECLHCIWLLMMCLLYCFSPGHIWSLYITSVRL